MRVWWGSRSASGGSGGPGGSQVDSVSNGCALCFKWLGVQLMVWLQVGAGKLEGAAGVEGDNQAGTDGGGGVGRMGGIGFYQWVG